MISMKDSGSWKRTLNSTDMENGYRLGKTFCVLTRNITGACRRVRVVLGHARESVINLVRTLEASGKPMKNVKGEWK